MANWRIFVLGAEAVLSLDGRIVHLPDLSWTLLGCLLSSPGHIANRSRIAAELWPESDEDAARHCLATSLWRMKQRLPCLNALLKSDGDRIGLHIGPRVWIDALSLERRAQRVLSDSSWLRSDINRSKARRALQLYRGEFLTRQDNDMILIERERVRALYLDASFHLAFIHAQHGEWHDSLNICRALCAVEPLREDAQRLLIKAYAECGNRALAIQQYHDLEDLLSRELSVRPMRETTDVIDRITLTADKPIARTSDVNRQVLLQAREQIIATVAMIDQALSQLHS